MEKIFSQEISREKHVPKHQTRQTRRLHHKQSSDTNNSPSAGNKYVSEYQVNGHEPVKSNMSSPAQILAQERIAKRQTFKDINQDRASLGLPPYQEDPELDTLANQRAQQLTASFSHTDKNGNALYLQDAKKDGMNLDSLNNNSAENIGNDSSYSSVYWPNNKGQVIKYITEEGGKTAANDINLDMFQSEKGPTPEQDGGHRQSIESKTYTKIGIGTRYLPRTQKYYIAEDFD